MTPPVHLRLVANICVAQDSLKHSITMYSSVYVFFNHITFYHSGRTFDTLHAEGNLVRISLRPVQFFLSNFPSLILSKLHRFPVNVNQKVFQKTSG